MTTQDVAPPLTDPVAVARHLGAEFAKEAPQRDTERRFAYAET